MARTVKEQEYAVKRGEILSAAQRLVLTQGYECMTIQGILAELHISSGAFYHYFDSKQAVLEALVVHMQQAVEGPLLPIVQDARMSAVEKLQAFFGTLDRSRAGAKAFLAGMVRVWYADDNAIVRQKVEESIVERRTPLLSAIVRQGLREGVFANPFAEQVGKVIIILQLGMDNSTARLMLAVELEGAHPGLIDEIVATHAVFTDAIERVLGARAPFLYRPDAAAVQEWLRMTAEEISYGQE